MAVGHAQHLKPPLTGPALGHQLLAWIHGKAMPTLRRFGPDIAAGPHLPEPPARIFSRPQQQGTTLLGCSPIEQGAQNDQQPLIGDQGGWRQRGHTDTLWALSRAVPISSSMIDTTAATSAAGTSDTGSSDAGTTPISEPAENAGTTTEATGGIGVNFNERYGEILGKVNHTLDQLDWDQLGRIGKSIGILVVVIVAQVLIKGVLDTINLLPIVPGLLELLGLVVVGQWSWKNLSTGDKRSAVISRLQHIKQEYLG
jgi:hypothetical protein